MEMETYPKKSVTLQWQETQNSLDKGFHVLKNHCVVLMFIELSEKRNSPNVFQYQPFILVVSELIPIHLTNPMETRRNSLHGQHRFGSFGFNPLRMPGAHLPQDLDCLRVLQVRIEIELRIKKTRSLIFYIF